MTTYKCHGKIYFLIIKRVHGYNVKWAENPIRNNIFYVSNYTEVVYNTSRLGVILHKEGNSS